MSLEERLEEAARLAHVMGRYFTITFNPPDKWWIGCVDPRNPEGDPISLGSFSSAGQAIGDLIEAQKQSIERQLNKISNEYIRAKTVFEAAGLDKEKTNEV